VLSIFPEGKVFKNRPMKPVKENLGGFGRETGGKKIRGKSERGV